MFSLGFYCWIKGIFVNKALKFSLAFLKNGKLFPKIFVLLFVGVTQVFSNSRVFVFFDALEKVSANIANIICITQITFEFIINTFINSGLLL